MKGYESIYVDTCGEGTTYFLLRASASYGQWHNVMDLEHTMCANSRAPWRLFLAKLIM